MEQLLKDSGKLAAALLLTAILIFLFFAYIQFDFRFEFNGQSTLFDTSFLMSQPLIFFSVIMLVGLPISVLWIFKKELNGKSTKGKIQSVVLIAGFLFLYLLLFTSLLPQLQFIFPGLMAYLASTKLIVPFAVLWVLAFGFSGVFLARKILKARA